MKTLHKTLVMAALALPLVVRGGIIGSPHDFSQRTTWNTDPANPATVCGVCHTPHHANPTTGPLWGHDLVSGGTWQMYANGVSPGAAIKYSPASAPTGSSLACLSCHDGSIALNAYGSASAPNRTGSAEYVTNGAAISFDQGLHQNLTHSHPISFSYQSIVGTGPTQDKWIYDSANPVLTPTAGSPGFVYGNDMSIAGFLLNKAGNVECNSCHDVHNQEGSPYNIVNNPHLVKINGTAPNSVNGLQTGSLLCRSCHHK